MSGAMGKIQDVFRAVTGARKKVLAVVILAGGAGSRMGGKLPKQLLPLGGVPVVARSLLAFETCPDVDEIVVVCRQGEENLYNTMAKEYAITKYRGAAVGGETRGASSIRGFAAVSEKADYVAFHDAARCLVTPGTITKVFREALACRTCAIAAMPVSDTMKETDVLGRVKTTLDRSHLMAAATPQIFRANVFRAVAYTAQQEGFVATDDAALAEHYGFEVRTVPCPKDNIKITYPEDLVIAEAILSARREKQNV